MAQQDKTDWYWNGVLAGGAVNNLYYDLINVDVVHVPYATHHRNSSFFLQTRLAYKLSKEWSEWEATRWYEVTDVKVLWTDTCTKDSWEVFIMWKKWKKKAIWHASIKDWCIDEEQWIDNCVDDIDQPSCADWKLFTTEYVKWTKYEKYNSIWNNDPILVKRDGTTATEVTGLATWIQINIIKNWTSYWLFSDINVENWYANFKSWDALAPWNYLLVYWSANWTGDWFAWQVRMITGKEWDRLTVDAPWNGFKVPGEDDVDENGNPRQTWYHVKYATFTDWWEIVGYTNDKNIEILYDPENCYHMSVYNQTSAVQSASARWTIVWVVEASDKMFVLTDNGYVHYSDYYGYDKFFIQDDMFAWVDKMSITSYRDMVLTFGRRHIAIGVPDEQNKFWTMYDQSQTLGLWSRYSFAEYDWDLIFVTNDKRLLALWVASTAWRYMLQHEDVWANTAFNSKLSGLIPGDEVFIWNDNNNLRIFVNTKPFPYKKNDDWDRRADLNENWGNSMTHIYKFDTLFRVRTEDHINGILLKWATEWVYFWERGIYIRDNSSTDEWWREFNAYISAYLIENEADWSWTSGSWLANRPKLYNTAKLNRLLTMLWPWIYSNNTKIKITTYSKWIWYIYEFPISWEWNDWLGLITSYYLEEPLTREEREKIECMLSILQDGQKQYQPDCPNSCDGYCSDWGVKRQYVAQSQPRCHDYDELLTESHWVCINDKLYELAPTMPLTTTLWENQPYATQIKLELIWGVWDIICFGWRIWEMFIAPIFTTGPDWEYQLQPNTDCD